MVVDDLHPGIVDTVIYVDMVETKYDFFFIKENSSKTKKMVYCISSLLFYFFFFSKLNFKIENFVVFNCESRPLDLGLVSPTSRNPWML